MNKKITHLVAMLVIVALFLTKNQVFAQQAQPFDLGITPTTAYVHVQPGKEIAQTIIIKNEGIFTLNITPHLINFSSDQKTGAPILEKDTLINILKSKIANFQNQKNTTKTSESNPQINSELIKYINFINPDVNWSEDFTLKPGEEKKLIIKIAPPLTEPNTNTPLDRMGKNSQILETEHHLSIIFAGSNKFSSTSNKSYAQVSGVVASNLIAFFSDEKNDAGKLTISKVSTPRLIDSFSQISFSILSKNVGRNSTPNSGKATITSLSNHTLAEYVFYPDMILANSSREVRGIKKETWDQINEKAKKQPENQQELNLEIVSQLNSDFQYKSPFLLGIYNINLELGEEIKTIKIVALPISIILIAIVAILTFLSLKILKKILKNAS